MQYKKDSLNGTTFSNIDDLCKRLVLDPLYPQNTRKMKKRKESIDRKNKLNEELKLILNVFCKTEAVSSIVEKLMELVKKEKLLYEYEIPETKYLKIHLASYIHLLKSKLKIEKCNSYSKDNLKGLKLISTEPIKKNHIIDDLMGATLCINDKEEVILTSQKIDFSVMKSSKHGKSLLLLGPVALINHKCDANCKYVSTHKNVIKIQAIKNIEAGEELFCYYGDSYFGPGNQYCECEDCKKSIKILDHDFDSINEVEQDAKNLNSHRPTELFVQNQNDMTQSKLEKSNETMNESAVKDAVFLGNSPIAESKENEIPGVPNSVVKESSDRPLISCNGLNAHNLNVNRYRIGLQSIPKNGKNNEVMKIKTRHSLPLNPLVRNLAGNRRVKSDTNMTKVIDKTEKNMKNVSVQLVDINEQQEKKFKSHKEDNKLEPFKGFSSDEIQKSAYLCSSMSKTVSLQLKGVHSTSSSDVFVPKVTLTEDKNKKKGVTNLAANDDDYDDLNLKKIEIKKCFVVLESINSSQKTSSDETTEAKPKKCSSSKNLKIADVHSRIRKSKSDLLFTKENSLENHEETNDETSIPEIDSKKRKRSYNRKKLYSSPENANVSVEISSNDEDSSPTDSKQKKRKIQKKKITFNEKKSKNFNQLCIYCEKIIFFKFTEHLLTHHSEEKAVIVYKNLKEDDPDRKLIISFILHKGYSMYNNKYHESIPVSKKRVKENDNIKVLKKNCDHCGALYSNESLRKHVVKCKRIKNLIKTTWRQKLASSKSC